MDGSVDVCRFTISSYLSVRVGSGYRAEYYFIYFPAAVHTTQGRKRVVLQVGGSVEVCRVTISSYLSVRVGSGYRAEYYFIYFPVAVHTTQGRKRVVLQVGGSVEVCRFTISSYLSVRVGSGYRVQYYFIYFPVAVQNTGKRTYIHQPSCWPACVKRQLTVLLLSRQADRAATYPFVAHTVLNISIPIRRSLYMGQIKCTKKSRF